MSKPQALEKDWYLKLANKGERSRPVLNDIAETSLRNLDTLMVSDREERRRRREERKIRSIDMSERFTVVEIAKKLKVAESTIYEWIDNGTIEAEYHGPTGRLIRISQTAFENYLRKR